MNKRRGILIETGFREGTGRYQQRFYPKITPEHLEQAKLDLICAACQTEKGPSDTVHVGYTGLCWGCDLAIKINGYVVLTRDPTIEEVLKQWSKVKETGKTLTNNEVAVLVQEIKSPTTGQALWLVNT